jgi:hypothetical protein
MKHDPIHLARPARAFVLFRSGRRLDLLNPRSDGWTDEDLAHNLARISRWGGATRWRQSLSVAQHSLLVLKIREIEEDLTPREALRELLHDASEGLLGWDSIGPLKYHLGEPFRQLEHRLIGPGRRALRPAVMGSRRLSPAQGRRSARRRLRSPSRRRLEPRRYARRARYPLRAHRGGPSSDAWPRTLGAVAAAPRRVDVPPPAPRPSSHRRSARKRQAMTMPKPSTASLTSSPSALASPATNSRRTSSARPASTPVS